MLGRNRLYGLKLRLPPLTPNFVSKASIDRQNQAIEREKKGEASGKKTTISKLPSIQNSNQSKEKPRMSHPDGTNTLTYSETVFNEHSAKHKENDTVFKFTDKNNTNYKVGRLEEGEDNVSEVIEEEPHGLGSDFQNSASLAKSQNIPLNSSKRDGYKDIAKSDFVESRYSKAEGDSPSLTQMNIRDESKPSHSPSHSGNKLTKPDTQEFDYCWFEFFTHDIYCNVTSVGVKTDGLTYYLPFGVAKIAAESKRMMLEVLRRCLFKPDNSVEIDYDAVLSLKEDDETADKRGLSLEECKIGGKEYKIL